MIELKTLLSYIGKKHPGRLFSLDFLQKLAYAIDWMHALHDGQTLTTSQWIYGDFGPTTIDFENQVLDAGFNISAGASSFGEMRKYAQVSIFYSFLIQTQLSDKERMFVDGIMQAADSMYWGDFLRIILSSYPLLITPPEDTLNLPKLAVDYNRDRNLFWSGDDSAKFWGNDSSTFWLAGPTLEAKKSIGK